MSKIDTVGIDWDEVKHRLCASELALQQSSTIADERLEDIFRQRAQRLATRATQGPEDLKLTPVLAFRLGNETYGICLRDVAQVFPNPACTPVPGAPTELVGVANLQGEVRSVLDLRSLLGLPESDVQPNRYVLLLRQNVRKVGLRVEQIEGVRPVDPDSVTPAVDVVNASARYVQGLTHDNLVLLCTDAFFEPVLSTSIST